MSVFKCKMCGGTIEFEAGATVGVCDSCGTKQTLPKTADDTVANLFNRANNLRLKCEFDKAASIYEKIVEQDDSEAEAHWGIILCKYGIEYVDDPKTGKKIPTCHRTLFEAVTSDADYQAAVDYSDAIQQALYESEAREIDRIQKDILSIVKNEKPFDVFICYKETDENGKRTQDSVIANDIYYQLTQEGFKVFYAAITLEDKLGREYEPYIFAALNSAKVMLVVGTNPLYFNSVWVRNEWSRYLALMKTDRSKLLIPCYRDMDAYELPEEFSHLQAQDMSKIGFINDVVRGIKKVLTDEQKETASAEKATVSSQPSANISPLIERAFLFLEDGEWQDAYNYCEKVLDIDPKNAEAYLGKLMAELKIHKPDNLKNCQNPFDDNNNYKKVMRFGNDELKERISSYCELVRTEQENKKRAQSDEENEYYKKYTLKINNLEEELNTAKHELYNLGVFSFYEKKEKAALIEKTEAELKKVQNDMTVFLRSKSVNTQLLLNNGSGIVFGNYHGLIEWVILKAEKDKILVLSKYALDSRCFHNVYKSVSWEDCSLRKWLNTEFIKTAFNDEERNAIMSTEVVDENNSKYGTPCGCNTQDKIFLLSISEAEQYFMEDTLRICAPSGYAVSQKIYTDAPSNCLWWLRSPGQYKENAVCVGTSGSIGYVGRNADRDFVGVRPAMWISLNT